MTVSRHRIVRAALLLVCGLWACKGAPLVVYEGPPRPLDQIAVLDTIDPSRTRVVRIDDQEVRGATFHLAPGVHELWVKVNVTMREDMMMWNIKMWCGIAVDFEAAQAYEVVLVNEKIRGTTRGSEINVGAKIAHLGTGEEFHPAACRDEPNFAR